MRVVARCASNGAAGTVGMGEAALLPCCCTRACLVASGCGVVTKKLFSRLCMILKATPCHCCALGTAAGLSLHSCSIVVCDASQLLVVLVLVC